MHRHLLGLAFVFLLSACALPSTADAQDSCSHWDGDDLHLAGTVGAAEVRVFLSTGYPSQDRQGVSGVFIYSAAFTGVNSASALDGKIAGCEIRVDESNEQNSDHASWVVRFVARDRLEGVRTAPAPGVALPIALHSAAPLDCSGKGPWRTFRSAKWPITFSYPASWQVSEDDYLELVCPEPSRLAWGGFPITLEQGSDFDATVDASGKPGRRAGWFVRFDAGGWMRALYDDCDSSQLDSDSGLLCSHARSARRFGMTVVQANGGEDRHYRPGAGYVGQGGGTIGYLFTTGARWVQLVSHEPPEWSDEIERGGPARFDGAGITERLVRSVRLRAPR